MLNPIQMNKRVRLFVCWLYGCKFGGHRVGEKPSKLLEVFFCCHLADVGLQSELALNEAEKGLTDCMRSLVSDSLSKEIEARSPQVASEMGVDRNSLRSIVHGFLFGRQLRAHANDQPYKEPAVDALFREAARHIEAELTASV